MEKPIGIDLGTTYSAAAYLDEDGRPQVVCFEDGRTLLPSVVQFAEDGVIVGELAKDNAVAFPDEVVTSVKRFMGDPNWRFTVRGKTYSPVDVSAEILRSIRAAVAGRVGHVAKAVVTVPAYFRDRERNATIQAAKQAGLDVLRILNEPTAAAISYGLGEDQSDQTILVYDLGGGHLTSQS